MRYQKLCLGRNESLFQVQSRPTGKHPQFSIVGEKLQFSLNSTQWRCKVSHVAHFAPLFALRKIVKMTPATTQLTVLSESWLREWQSWLCPCHWKRSWWFVYELLWFNHWIMIKNFIFLEEREVNVLVIYRNIDLACGVGTRAHLELFSKPTSHTFKTVPWSYMRPKVRLALTKPDRRGKIVCFLYMNDF